MIVHHTGRNSRFSMLRLRHRVVPTCSIDGEAWQLWMRLRFVTTLLKTPGRAAADTLASASVPNDIDVPGGIARVTQQLTAALQKDPNVQLFPEITMAVKGHDQLRAGALKSTIGIYRLNLLAYPESADAYADLADAYLADGQKKLARQQAEKALALLDSGAPASSWSNTEPRRGEIRRGAQQVLQKVNAAR
jgi:hypothetical protein